MNVSTEESLSENSLPKIRAITVGLDHRGLIDLVEGAPGAGASFPVAPPKKPSGLSSLAVGLFKRNGLS